MAQTKIVLAEIKCLEPSEFGKDEVYVKYKIDEKREDRFPASGYHSMGKGDIWLVELPLTFENSVDVGLYDNDTGGDDFLGNHTYFPSTHQPSTFPVENTNGARYELHTKVMP